MVGEAPRGGSGPDPQGWDPAALAGALASWAGAEAARRAAGERTRQRWLTQQATEAATLAGVLVDLAEQRASVSLRTPAQTYTGDLVGVGQDFCVLAGRSTALVALDALVSLTPTSGRGAAPTGDRSPVLPLRLADALAMLGAERSPVRLDLSGGDGVNGTVRAVGEDIVQLVEEGPARRPTVIPVSAIVACTPR